MKKGLKGILFLGLAFTLISTIFLALDTKKDVNAASYFKRIKISSCDITLNENEFDYTGKEIEPEVTVTYEGSELKQNRDYSVTYLNNVKIGKAYVIVKGKGENYKGIKRKSFYISDRRVDINNCKIELDSYNYEWTGETINPKVSIYNNEQELEEDVDYTLTYSNNKDAGVAKVIIVGKGKFKGQKEVNYNINGIDIAKECLFKVKNQQVYVYYKGELLEPENYTITYKTYEYKEGYEKAEVKYCVITGVGQFQGEYKLEILSHKKA